ncbi:MAG: glycoside hydrolase family 57 protein [Bacteroidales bacterium]|nr:glycoside hydrolase family 57 protein [Bacteroidales bacterium]MBR6160430.1 glycoside hydrolase family 57 protein [Bacteroidales bacterium]
MNRICFHFQISQPYRLRTYRFFDINQNHDYFDDYQNHYLTKRLAERCYLPANKMMLELIKKYPDTFKLSFSISGSSIELFKNYCPEVIESFKELIATGCVEITGSTFTHSIASLYGKDAFMEQIHLQENLLQETFGVKPVSFCNTEIIYSDEIGEWLGDAGYRVILTEGARHILGWKSPTYLYCNPYQTDVRLLLRTYKLCDDITLRFNDYSWDQYPLTADKYMWFLNNSNFGSEAPFINLYWDYETIGEHYTADTGIFDFFRDLVDRLVANENYSFITPKEVLDMDVTTATMHAPWPISCSGEEKDTHEWIGNELQQEAFNQLFKLQKLYDQSTNPQAKLSWLQLQAADHFNFMSSKWFGHRFVKRNFEVYSSPYQAFINYMNVLNDVKLQLEK